MKSISLKLFIIFNLIFPMFYSIYTDVYQSAYYGGFSWAYLFLVLYMGLQFWGNERKNWKPWIPYLIVLGIYNLLSLYFNYKYLHWYWEQINNSVAFLFFMVLVGCEAGMDDEKQDHIRFLIHCIVLSNVASIIYFLLGYTKLLVCNNRFVFFRLPGDFYETRHYWLYSHKSEYSLMLIAFLALFVCYRKKFRNRITYILSVLILFVCLYLTHSWTGVIGVPFIFLGDLLDRIDLKKLQWKKQYFIAGLILLLIVGSIGYKMFSERDIMTLGNRTQIWSTVLGTICHHPEGWGMRFGESAIQVSETLLVNNGHNIFLNAMLRFSVPVGICFSILFLGTAIYSVVKARSFLAAGMWVAMLILLNMDYALMSLQMALVFLIVYLVCFYKRKVQHVE
ncbi:MAG: hypothetical protein HFI28_07145 [Lachnospiraceae bacterium]|jgi:hypothetical protein|nr:hypothetical protein [Lachnospiraceae bacterium]